MPQASCNSATKIASVRVGRLLPRMFFSSWIKDNSWSRIRRPFWPHGHGGWCTGDPGCLWTATGLGVLTQRHSESFCTGTYKIWTSFLRNQGTITTRLPAPLRVTRACTRSMTRALDALCHARSGGASRPPSTLGLPTRGGTGAILALVSGNDDSNSGA